MLHAASSTSGVMGLSRENPEFWELAWFSARISGWVFWSSWWGGVVGIAWRMGLSVVSSAQLSLG